MVVTPSRATLLSHEALIRGYNYSGAAVLCEPSLARTSARPPDAVLVDPAVGVHVVEVKGVSLDQIEDIEPGGLIVIRYGGTVRRFKRPIAQARNAMFDIRDAASRLHDGELTLPFKYWAVMPSIGRNAWFERFGPGAFAPPELLFADDLPRLAEVIRAAGGRAAGPWPESELPDPGERTRLPCMSSWPKDFRIDRLVVVRSDATDPCRPPQEPHPIIGLRPRPRA